MNELSAASMGVKVEKALAYVVYMVAAQQFKTCRFGNRNVEGCLRLHYAELPSKKEDAFFREADRLVDRGKVRGGDYAVVSGHPDGKDFVLSIESESGVQSFRCCPTGRVFAMA